MFNEAPKFIRSSEPETLQRGIQQGIKIGIDAIAGAARRPRPRRSPRAVRSPRTCVPTAQRARKLVYAPDLDGRADPGEIVWTWVVYEDDPTRGKDRPVLVVGRDRRTLLGLMLSSQEHHRNDPNWVGIGSGSWDYEGRAELGAAGPGARRARGGHPARGRDPGARDVRGRRRAAARRVLLELRTASAPEINRARRRFAPKYPNEPSGVSPHDRPRDGVITHNEEPDVVGVH